MRIILGRVTARPYYISCMQGHTRSITSFICISRQPAIIPIATKARRQSPGTGITNMQPPTHTRMDVNDQFRPIDIHDIPPQDTMTPTRQWAPLLYVKLPEECEPDAPHSPFSLCPHSPPVPRNATTHSPMSPARDPPPDDEEETAPEGDEPSADEAPEQTRAARDKKRPKCRYFGTRRGCRNGTTCSFSHDM